jgi:hypothetical protein
MLDGFLIGFFFEQYQQITIEFVHFDWDLITNHAGFTRTTTFAVAGSTTTYRKNRKYY